MSQNIKSSKQNQKISPERIGLIPAAGQATRISPLPCSKELYPLGFRQINQGRSIRPKVVCHYLLEKMHIAGVTKAYVILRKNKWDIPAYFGDGKLLDMHLAYLMLGLPYGVPYTLDQAYPFIQHAMVVFGFPDIIFKPKDAFLHLLNRQAESKADVVLGLFLARQPQKVDMVDLDREGMVRGIQIKPARTDRRYTWIIAVWTPVFTHFMHEYVSSSLKENNNDQTDYSTAKQCEVFMGDVIHGAIEQGIIVIGHIFAGSRYIDIGTPEDLYNAANMNVNF
jgi:glucose-1-phosphate thymidylyltransferase